MLVVWWCILSKAIIVAARGRVEAGKGGELTQKGCLLGVRGHPHHVISHPRVIFEPNQVWGMGITVQKGDCETANGGV